MELVLKDLTVNIDNKEIIKKINVELKNKEFIGLIGPNGSGKTTILRTIYRGLKKTRGNIYLADKNLDEITISESAKKIGVMKQVAQIAFDFKVLELVLMGRIPHKQPFELNNEEDYRIAEESLRIVGLEAYGNRYYNSLSGGEQQRVMIARVLAGKPETLLLDEMTNHLDIYYQFSLLNIVKQLNIEVLAVMHDLNLTARYCDKVYCLSDGKVVACGKTEDVLTEKLLSEVFRVKAIVNKDSDGLIYVAYQGI